MFILRAIEEDGTKNYFVNLICVTEQAQTAKKYETIEDACADVPYFKNLFYGNPEIAICEIRETKQPFITKNAGE